MCMVVGNSVDVLPCWESKIPSRTFCLAGGNIAVRPSVYSYLRATKTDLIGIRRNNDGKSWMKYFSTKSFEQKRQIDAIPCVVGGYYRTVSSVNPFASSFCRGGNDRIALSV